MTRRSASIRLRRADASPSPLAKRECDDHDFVHGWPLLPVVCSNPASIVEACKMAKKSAGLLYYRVQEGSVEVLLAHPGGPFWARKDDGAWSIPKGEFSDDEDPLAAAQREFAEETGLHPDETALRGAVSLGTVPQSKAKTTFAWAIPGNFDPSQLRSNTFSMEWPPRSGKFHEFPEIDRLEWFSLAKARQKLLAGQRPFLDRLEALLG